MDDQSNGGADVAPLIRVPSLLHLMTTLYILRDLHHMHTMFTCFPY